MTTTRTNPLDTNVPTSGRAADAYAVAVTAGYLEAHAGDAICHKPLERARHATTLHVISGRLHRLAERQCNEDLTCYTCKGDGEVKTTAPEHSGGLPVRCWACAGHGTTIGRRLERLRADAKAIAEHYGLRAYFQGDPRGCSLYLIDPSMIPSAVATLDGKALPPNSDYWINANYSRGHAVVRLGR